VTGPPSSAVQKFYRLCTALERKINQSQATVPGFIVGLSGTDSVVAFVLAYRAMQSAGLNLTRLLGVHYVTAGKGSGWFMREVLPWLQEQCPHAKFLIAQPLGGNQDQQRWADLHMRALNSFDLQPDLSYKFNLLPQGQNYWVLGTINATERALGTYSVLADTASVQPINSMWKAEVLDVCHYIGVPAIAIEYAQQPDCWCGRDELAAQNIPLLDSILRHTLVPSEHPPELLDQMFEYVRTTQHDNGFKQRIPYKL
jgi:NH3-dependent NAD+ synthetase